jgi:biopolymer transport protein ExbB
MDSLVKFFQAGGFVMWPLLFLSIFAVTVIIERFLTYRTLGSVSPGLLNRTLALIESDQPEAALEAIRRENGVMAECIRTVLENQRLAASHIERAVQEVGEEQFTKLERYLPILDTTTTISPLLGLLGTLAGMIGTFNRIAAAKNSGANDSILSGVGEALFATATGLSIAIVCFIAYNYFAARQRMIVSETELAATKLLNVLIAKEAVGIEVVHLDRDKASATREQVGAVSA